VKRQQLKPASVVATIKKSLMRQFILLISLLTSIKNFSQDINYTIDTIQVKSEILNENRSIIVYKPQNILETDSVKLIYLLDGEYSNHRFHSFKERFKDSISNLIAVGVINSDRKRDLLYVNSADKFLEFITSELIPVVENGHTINTRILYGHSFGGGFTIYSLINRPDYFNCYIASSPTPIMDLVKEENYLQIDSLCKHKTVFYFSFGSEDMGQVRKWSEILKDNLTGLTFKNLEWRFNIFEGKDHNNSDIAALLNGLNDLKK
jgi:predicted alpha/beta superfamily hydrolase